MREGVIVKALSGFYYVKSGDELVSCRAKGKFRHDNMTPLVGDRVFFSDDGVVEKLLERKNCFIRPAVANIDALVFIASAAKPVTDPFLIDRVSVIAANENCELIICINKSDIEDGRELYGIYSSSGFPCVITSAETGEGIDELKSLIAGKTCAFTGNSGVGKSSILNALIPGTDIETAEISDKLGRGKHTTRHIEFYELPEGGFVADSPGFASFEIEMMDEIPAENLDSMFIDFEPFLGSCRFDDCRHVNEPGCAVKNAVADGRLKQSRYDSYIRLYDIVKNHKPWD